MKIELKVNVFNVKKGKINNILPEEFAWEVLDVYFTSKKMPKTGSMFYSPNSFVFWESTNYPITIDHSKYLEANFFQRKLLNCFSTRIIGNKSSSLTVQN